MPDEKSTVGPQETKKIIAAAIASGAVSKDLSVKDMINLGDKIDAVAGYVCAWDRYVLVVANDIDLTPEITFGKSAR